MSLYYREEVPIENGIPQWNALSYQCVSAALQKRPELRELSKDQHDEMQPKKISRSKLMESSFIGAFPEADSRDLVKSNEDFNRPSNR